MGEKVNIYYVCMICEFLYMSAAAESQCQYVFYFGFIKSQHSY